MEKMFWCVMMMRLRPHIREGRGGQTSIFLKRFEVKHPDGFVMFFFLGFSSFFVN